MGNDNEIGELSFTKKTLITKKDIPPKTILMHPAGIHDGCTAWRFDWIRSYMNYNKLAHVQMTNLVQPVYTDTKEGKIINPIYVQADAVVVQRPTQEIQKETSKHFQFIQNLLRKSDQSPFRFIIDVDDVIHGEHISQFNVARKGYADNKRFQIFKEVVERSDELHVCSPTMRDFYKEVLDFDNVTSKPNLLPNHLFGHFYDREILNRRYEKHKNKPRILWAGSATHVDVGNINNGIDDFSHIREFVLKTLDKYQWVFVGILPNWLKNEQDKVEFHKWVNIMDYPSFIWSLEPTVIFTPLHDDMFNRCKSNIKLTEAGIFGVAGVFQNLDPYVEAPLKFDTGEELGDHLNYLLSDWDNYDIISKEMRSISEGYLLENNKDMLISSYFTDVGSRERNIIERTSNY